MKRGATMKVERKTVEKNRRTLMKTLCSKLFSLIPNNYLAQPKELLSSLPDQIDHSAAYIENLKERVEELRRKKTELMMTNHGRNKAAPPNNAMVETNQSKPINLSVKELGSGVEVVLITGLATNFMISEVIAIIEQEAAQVLTVSIATIHDKIIHTIHAQVIAVINQVKISRVGVDAERISQRIKELF